MRDPSIQSYSPELSLTMHNPSYLKLCVTICIHLVNDKMMVEELNILQIFIRGLKRWAFFLSNTLY